MRIFRTHPLLDGTLMACLVLSSFGVFVYVLAQTSTLDPRCLEANITDPVTCSTYLQNSATSGTAATTTASVCTDSDGRKYDVSGYVMVGSAALYDRCLDSRTVEEQFCDGIMALVEPHYCGAGMLCMEGKCITDPNATTTSSTTPTTTTTTSAGVCADTDGGKAYGVSGTVSYAGESYPDVCLDTFTVEEHFCLDGGRSSILQRCADGMRCEQGRCIAVTAATSTTTTQTTNTNTNTAPPTATCADTDGGDAPAVYGELTYAGMAYKDTCADSRTVDEQFCVATGRARASRTCASGMECKEGRCVVVTATAVCGNEKCESALGETSGSCPKDCPSATSPVTGITTTENKETETRPTTVVTCGDSDGGKAYATLGKVIVGTASYTDRCLDSSTLEENFCDGTLRKYEQRKCGDGMRCDAGRCILAPVSVPTSVCGNGVCEGALGESTASCPKDCPAAETAGDVFVTPVQEETERYAADIQTYIPEACVEKGIKDPSACAAYMEERAATESATVTLPQECVAAGVSTKEECARYFEERAVHETCRSAGITSIEACRKYLVSTSVAATVSDACREAGVLTAAACEGFQFDRERADETATTVTLPSRCVAAQVMDPIACAKYIAYADLPLECLKAGVETRERCEEFLRNKYVHPVCASQGITQKDACEEFIFGRAAANVSCAGIDAAQCAVVVKERHLGAVMDANVKIGEIEERLADAVGEGEHIDLAALGEDDTAKRDRIAEVLPIKTNERRFLALASETQLAVEDDDSVSAAVGRVIAYDTDGDGLPDDMETRLGSDPKNPDTDGDGIDDKTELRGGADQLAGIDRAIMEGKAIGQPLTEGDTDPSLTVALPEEAAGDETAEPRGVVFEGTGEPGAVVTLYLYSELPVVVTTTVGEDGTWSYAFEDSLSEGTHEVYVAINDDTGRVARKSNPLSFLVRGAAAASTAQAAEEAALAGVSPFVAAQQAPEYDLRLFLAGGAALMLLAIGLVAALYRKPQQLLP